MNLAAAHYYERRIEELEEERAALLAVCDLIYDSSPCSFDHHGNCQQHGCSNPCEMELIRKAYGLIQKHKENK